MKYMEHTQLGNKEDGETPDLEGSEIIDANRNNESSLKSVVRALRLCGDGGYLRANHPRNTKSTP